MKNNVLNKISNDIWLSFIRMKMLKDLGRRDTFKYIHVKCISILLTVIRWLVLNQKDIFFCQDLLMIQNPYLGMTPLCVGGSGIPCIVNDLPQPV